MKSFATLLDRLAFEDGRNAKLRLLADYFRTTPDPDRGYALAAITGALSFRHAKPGLIRALIAERTDPDLFAMSYDYVGDLSETVVADVAGGGSPVGGSGSRREACGAPCPRSSRRLKRSAKPNCRRASRTGSTSLDETGRWALLKLITGALRIGVSARLAKTAVAALGKLDAERHRNRLARA